MTEILTLGEVMIELAEIKGEGRAIRTLGFAGDTFNTAIYLARLGVDVGYKTRLGDDDYSAQILAIMNAEAVDGTLVEQVPGRVPGLYMIANNEVGERHFHYWRGESPAREMLGVDEQAQRLKEALSQCGWLYFSGITLGIISASARERLFRILADFRARGGRVAFDSNYRPRLWQSLRQVREAMASALSLTDLALLTDEDEQALWGDREAAGIVSRCAGAGVGEVVVKRGLKPVLVAFDLTTEKSQYRERLELPVAPVAEVVDTTAAGDSFNAGYLAERMRGGDVTAAVRRGAKCAGIVIGHKGAIVAPGLVTWASTA